MQKLSVFIFSCIIVFASCKKDNDKNCSAVNVTAAAAEVETLRTYVTANDPEATEDPRGFFYHINTPGDKKPNICNDVTVTYTGKFTNGSQFDAASNVTFPLSNLIIGWQEGIPLIGTGGSITLYVPPSLGYGASDYGSIPGNSYLVFNIQLNDVN